MNLEDLKKEIPFKWRVQSTNQYGAKCVAYIDARDVQDILDKVCGQDGWQTKYTEHKGNLFCSIGISQYLDTDGNITEFPTVWKEDCGTESNVEKQKGEASDAFKRAGVMWGIGRFLYSKKIITIKEVKQNGQRFEPTENGKKIWDITEYCNRMSNIKPPTKPVVKPNLTDKLLQDTLLNGSIDDLRALLNDYNCTGLQTKAITIRGKELANGK